MKRKEWHWNKWVINCGVRSSKMKMQRKLVEKLVEKQPYRGGLKITAGKRKNPKPVDTQQISDLVPVTGLKPVRCRQRWILRASIHSVSNGM